MGEGSGVVGKEKMTFVRIKQWLERSKFQRQLIQAATLACVSPAAQRIARDLADQEKWRYEALRLGASNDDLERHNEVVKAMGRSSPIFSNRQVWRAGWKLVKRSLAGGEEVIPDPVDLWALRLWNLAMEEEETSVVQSLQTLGIGLHSSGVYLSSVFSLWVEKAEELWE